MSIEPFTLHVQTAPHHIDFLNLAIVSTLDNQEGIVAIRGFGKVGPVRRILRGLPFSAKIVYNSAEDVTK